MGREANHVSTPTHGADTRTGGAEVLAGWRRVACVDRGADAGPPRAAASTLKARVTGVSNGLRDAAVSGIAGHG